jgi:hypothetical protein
MSLIEVHGFFRDLSMDSIMLHMQQCNAFIHGKDQVRDMARQVTVECYREFGDDVRPYLKSLRPKQLEEYEAAFSSTKPGKRRPKKQGGEGHVGDGMQAERRQLRENNAGGGAGPSPSGKKPTKGGKGGKGGARGGGGGRGGAGNDGNMQVSAGPGPSGTQQLKISNAAGDGRDININISLNASPVRGQMGMAGGGVEAEESVEDNPFTWYVWKWQRYTRHGSTRCLS